MPVSTDVHVAAWLRMFALPVSTDVRVALAQFALEKSCKHCVHTISSITNTNEELKKQASIMNRTIAALDKIAGGTMCVIRAAISLPFLYHLWSRLYVIDHVCFTDVSRISNTVISAIHRKKTRDAVIMGLVIGSMICFTLWWTVL